ARSHSMQLRLVPARKASTSPAIAAPMSAATSAIDTGTTGLRMGMLPPHLARWQHSPVVHRQSTLLAAVKALDGRRGCFIVDCNQVGASRPRGRAAENGPHLWLVRERRS